ncbi:MAG: hypothetical protein ACM3NT_01500 [Methylocystaceae bacterium]
MIFTLDLGHLSGAGYTAPLRVQKEFIETVKNGQLPVTLALTADNEIARLQQLALHIRSRYEYVLVLGIGGSALGARAIISFVKGPHYNLKNEGPQLFILDNLDSVLIRETEAQIDLKKTCLIYVSKSGSTPETAAAFMYFSNQVREAGGTLEDTVIICDGGDNGINHLAERIGCHLVHLPSRLPGRYSVLSAAGLLPAAITGVDISQLVKGARAVQASLLNDAAASPLFKLGDQLFSLQRDQGKLIHVLFNYASILTDFGLWYMQLWAESLGKKTNLAGETIHAGSTPLACVGATDQHSLLQLFKEGPADKIYGFIGIQDQGEQLVIPQFTGSEKEYAYLSGHSLQHQLEVEQLATQISLFNTGHPCYQITLAEQSPLCLGALFYFYQMLVAYIAYIWEIDAFNQPGVEEGKNITYSLLGRSDYLEKREYYQQQVAKYLDRCRRYQV